jgi:uncharacterized alpha-E superfamily protein
VLTFLFQDAEFPRSIRFSLLQIEHCLASLPRGGAVTKGLLAVARSVLRLEIADLDNEALHAEVDRLQLALADLNQQMTDTWFLPIAPPVRT